MCIHDALPQAPDGELFEGLNIPTPAASIFRLVVRNDYQRLGIGTSLDKVRIDFAKKSRAKAVLVTPLDIENRKQALIHQGFRPIDRRGVANWSPTVSTVVRLDA
jgi:GNAT superfamily N-acetyltransferase